MKKRLFVNILLLMAVGLLIFTLSEFIQWNGDAYSYRFNYANGNPIRSVGEIFQSQYEHYFLMNGRIWAHVLCQGFSALWGQKLFALCNAIVYILFILLFVRISGMVWRRAEELLLCTLTVLFFCDVSYIPNCQIGYIWTSTAILAFLIQYFRAKDGQKKYKAWELALLFFLALLAGNGNEAIAIGVGGALIVDIIINIRRLNVAQYVMLAGFGAGGLLLCLSPGILDRASEDGANMVWSLYRMMIYSRMPYVMILTLIFLKCTRKIRLRDFVKENLFFFIAMVVLLIFNFIIGIGFTNRQLFGVELFAGIITCRALKGTPLPKWVLMIFSVLIVVIYLMKFDYLKKSNGDLRTIRKELENSDSLRIFVDFHKYPSFVHPSEQTNLYKEYKYNVWTTFEDMTDYAYIDSVKRYDTIYSHNVAVYPTVLKKVLRSKDRNFAARCADGAYLVVQDKENPKRFFLEREYNFLGIRWAKEPYEIEFADDLLYQNIDGLNILYWNFDTPLVTNGEIIMK